jgi:hypothetical protein
VLTEARKINFQRAPSCHSERRNLSGSKNL